MVSFSAKSGAEKEEGRDIDKHRCEREALIGCLSSTPSLGIVCTQTRDQTHNLAAPKTLQRTVFTAVAIHDLNNRNQWSCLVNNSSYRRSEHKWAMRLAPKRSSEVSGCE
ncbi:hypothetical protein HJG60_010087 [Phyllostomus discolor]|uniref:Uncharacterized protein n=1 Tax=Phyllostomus discolor TaxID=89673 RepID=A0A834AVW1_9CHIR|nr:hypothetical protein HJG60_010087 [Phyllostomus discolor]